LAVSSSENATKHIFYADSSTHNVTIADWNITPNSFTTGGFGQQNGFHMYPKGVSGELFNTDTNWKMVIGNNFGVTSNGTLYATNVDITGTINATNSSFKGHIEAQSGTIAGIELTQ
jgi:hypothetical protein